MLIFEGERYKTWAKKSCSAASASLNPIQKRLLGVMPRMVSK